MTYPANQQVPGGKPRLRGRILLRLAIIFAVLGAALVAFGVVVLVQKLGAVDDYARVSFAEKSRTVHFGRTGGYVAYYEAPGRNFTSTTSTPTVQITIRSVGGATVPVRQYGGSATYNLSGHSGTAIGTFQIATSGNYTVAIQTTDGGEPDGADMAFGESFAGGLVTGILLIVPGGLFLAAAVVLLIVGLVRRGGHKKELARGGGYRGYLPPPGGFYGGPPQGGGYPQGGYQGGPPPGSPS